MGVIPENWEVENLGQIADIKTGPFGSSLHERDYVSDGTPIITVEHLGELGIVHKDIPMVSEADKKRLNSYIIETNDIVFSRVGSVDRNSIVGERENGWLFSGRLLRIRVKSKKNSPKYLSYHFHQESFKQRIRTVAVGQTMASLNTEILRRISVVLPPTIAEQTAIATALSDADALINSLEKFIAKKRNIKQGAMQKLLQPKEGWVVKKLGEVCEFFNGKAHEQFIDENGNFIVVNSKFISTESEVFKNTSVNLFPLKRNDITMVMSDIPNGKALAKCFLIPIDNKFALNQRICAIRSETVDNKFLYYILNRNDYFLAFDSGSGQTNLRRIDVLECPLNLPSLKEDQTRIATILSDMDAEITALENKLEKYQEIKLGMMQNLLTGKIRLNQDF